MKSKYLMKPNSRVIENVMQEYDITKREAASALNITVERFKHKLVKNDFDIRDFIFLMDYATVSCSVDDNYFRKLKNIFREATSARKEIRELRRN